MAVWQNPGINRTDQINRITPKSWVTRVDDKVHIDRSAARAMQEWQAEQPDGIATSDTETGSSL